jgi:hypothetical protein
LLFGQQPVGPDFSLDISGAISDIQGGKLALGFWAIETSQGVPGATGDLSAQLQVSTVPEPRSLVLAALGLALVAGFRWARGGATSQGPIRSPRPASISRPHRSQSTSFPLRTGADRQYPDRPSPRGLYPAPSPSGP